MILPQSTKEKTPTPDGFTDKFNQSLIEALNSNTKQTFPLNGKGRNITNLWG
jgi:hypothetical protein